MVRNWLKRLRDVRGALSVALLGVVCLTLAHAQHDTQPSDKSVQRITKEVRPELIMLPYLDVCDTLAFKADGRDGRLRGSVPRPLLRSARERAVKVIHVAA